MYFDAMFPPHDSLVLQQLVLLAQLAQLCADGALGAAQRADLTAQVLFYLPAGLQVCLQLFNILLQSVPGWWKNEQMRYNDVM